jgi:hypothetical protein
MVARMATINTLLIEHEGGMNFRDSTFWNLLLPQATIQRFSLVRNRLRNYHMIDWIDAQLEVYIYVS